MTEKELSILLESEEIEVIEMPLKKDTKGLYGDNLIAINKNLSTVNEKKCVLMEELGHHYMNYGDITDQSKLENKRQERKARAWGYKRLVGIIDLINAYKYGVRNRYELAEYLDVTEEFIEDALKYYKEKYGPYYIIDNYIVYFEPLIVFESSKF